MKNSRAKTSGFFISRPMFVPNFASSMVEIFQSLSGSAIIDWLFMLGLLGIWFGFDFRHYGSLSFLGWSSINDFDIFIFNAAREPPLD